MNNEHLKGCPRCGEEHLRPWRELNEDQQEVVKRLPGSADYTLAERQSRHRWCTRCWFEATGGESEIA